VCQPERKRRAPRRGWRARAATRPLRSTRAASKQDGQAKARAADPAARRYDVRSRRD